MKIISEKFSIRLIVAGLILESICVIFFIYKSNLFDFGYAIQADKFGQLGDTVGGLVGSLWALAGVVLFYISLKEQRQVIATNEISLQKQNESLDLQRSELELQRKEYERSFEGFERQKEVYEEQSRSIKLQQFESTFYALLNVYIKIRNGLDILDVGKDFFGSLYKKMNDDFVPCRTSGENFNAAKRLYEEAYFDNKGRLTHYLKTIYRIIKIIDDSDLTDQQKYFYSKIVRSQFTEYELFILYYNSQIQFGTKFYPLIRRYNLLKHLPILSKLEFKELSIGITLPVSKTLFFQSWLDLFLEENLNVAYLPIDDVNPSPFTRSKQCSIIDGLVTEISVGSTTDIIFHFSAIKPDDDERFKTFIESYLYDRLYYSRYEEVTDSDNLSIMTGTHNNCTKFVFTLESSKDLKINVDTF